MKTNPVRSVASFTRPNDTTPYGTKDAVTAAVAAMIVFSGLGAAIQRAGYIRQAMMMKNGVVITNASFKLHFFSSPPAGGAIADNAVFDIFYVDAARYLGALTFASMTVETAGAGAMPVNQSSTTAFYLPIVTEGDDLYAALETQLGYTPIANEQFTFALAVEP